MADAKKASVWDTGIWDSDDWAAPPIPPPGWGDDWRWWYQVGKADPAFDLAPLLVEARWTTDSHTLGDGTFRGDLQPGALTVRLWDPGHLLDNLDKAGAVWALYKPTGAIWCWFYDSFSRGLVAPGDPQGADCVFSGTTWPGRMTSDNNNATLPAQSVTARLNAVVNTINLPNLSGLTLPTLTGDIATQSQTVAASVRNTQTGLVPSYLALVRDAASPGVAWLQPVPVTPGGATGGGALVLTYRRWETTNPRNLDHAQIIAGPPITASADWVVTNVVWQATNGATGVQTTFTNNGAVLTWGYQGPTFRVWGDVTGGASPGPEYIPCFQTGVQLVNDRSDGTEKVLSSIDVQSGQRTTAAGGVAPAAWDPYAHVFSPIDVVSILDDAGHAKAYRVTKSDHRLTAQVWQTTHTLEKYTAPNPLP